jgi:flagellar basal body-associated protein FliL
MSSPLEIYASKTRIIHKATPSMRRMKLVVIVLGLVLALAVATIAVAGFVFGLRMTTGYPHTSHTVYPTFLSCSIQNGSCEMTMRNQEPFSVEPVGCLFQHIYAIEGNGQTVTNYQTVTNNQTLTMTTVNIGTGVLSKQPKGLPFTTTIAVNSSAVVYCTPSASVPTPTVGGQANGEVQFTNQSLTAQFVGTWQK